MKIIIKKHAEQRMIQRLITLNDILETIKNGKYCFDGMTSRDKEQYTVVYKNIRLSIVKENNNIVVKTVMGHTSIKAMKGFHTSSLNYLIKTSNESNVNKSSIKNEIKLYKKEKRELVLSV